MTLTTLKARPRRKAAPRQQLRVAEFFAGIGLVRLALEQHGWKVVFANDIDPDPSQIEASALLR